MLNGDDNAHYPTYRYQYLTGSGNRAWKYNGIMYAEITPHYILRNPSVTFYSTLVGKKKAATVYYCIQFACVYIGTGVAV